MFGLLKALKKQKQLTIQPSPSSSTPDNNLSTGVTDTSRRPSKNAFNVPIGSTTYCHNDFDYGDDNTATKLRIAAMFAGKKATSYSFPDNNNHNNEQSADDNGNKSKKFWKNLFKKHSEIKNNANNNDKINDNINQHNNAIKGKDNKKDKKLIKEENKKKKKNEKKIKNKNKKNKQNSPDFEIRHNLEDGQSGPQTIAVPKPINESSSNRSSNPEESSLTQVVIAQIEHDQRERELSLTCENNDLFLINSQTNKDDDKNNRNTDTYEDMFKRSLIRKLSKPNPKSMTQHDYYDDDDDDPIYDVPLSKSMVNISTLGENEFEAEFEERQKDGLTICRNSGVSPYFHTSSPNLVFPNETTPDIAQVKTPPPSRDASNTNLNESNDQSIVNIETSKFADSTDVESRARIETNTAPNGTPTKKPIVADQSTEESIYDTPITRRY